MCIIKNVLYRLKVAKQSIAGSLHAGPSWVHLMYVRFTPLFDEAPGEIGDEVELDGITPDGAARISGVVNVSSALGIWISRDKSCSGSARARMVSRTLG